MTSPSLTSVAARFPLMPRSRPPARPIESRALRLAGLAASALRDHDSDQASTAFNGAALLASDCGAADLAAQWCRWHAGLYLTRPHLDAHSARFALEPLVNLARLRTRAGDGDGAYKLLIDLHHAVTHQTATTIDGVDLRADDWNADVARQPELTDWLRRVLLTDGTRALVTAGRWPEAVDHTCQHGGITAQLHDGRQVAVLATLLAGDTAAAVDMLLASAPEEPWEHSIKAILLAMCRHPSKISDEQRRTLLNLATNHELAPGSGLAVYRTRLGLTAVDIAGPGHTGDGQRLCERLCTDALADQDGHAVKDLLDHPLVPQARHGDLQSFLNLCGLHRGELPAAHLAELQQALHLAARTIQSRIQV